MKKFFSILLCVNIFLNITMLSFADDILEEDINYPVFLKQANNIPNVEAQSAIVIDSKTGRVLYEKNAYQKRPMASTTKIMTAIVALENGNLDDDVKISKRASSIGGSVIKLRENETYKLEDLLYGLLMKSGNDSAIAIAEHIGGNVQSFVEMMNKKAVELNAKDTHFINPHGLDKDMHYTTAYDLANIACYAMQNATFSKIVSTKTKTIRDGKCFNNTNELLYLYDGCNGVKTGFTNKAGRCLVTSVKRGDDSYISVVLGCETKNKRAQSSKEILDYAYQNYKRYELINKDELYTMIDVLKGKKNDIAIYPEDTIKLPLNQDEYQNIKINCNIDYKKLAPIKKGQNMGYVEFLVGDKIIAKTQFVTRYAVERKEFADYLKDLLVYLVTKI